MVLFNIAVLLGAGKMDEERLYLQRAENELVAAQMLFDISANEKLQKE